MALTTDHHLLLCHRSLADAADIDWSHSTGFEAGAGPEMLTDPRLWVEARTTGLTAQIVWGRTRPMAVSMVSLLGHTLSRTGRWAVDCADDPAFTAGVETLVDGLVTPVTKPILANPWGEAPWNGREEPDGQAVAIFPTRFKPWWRIRLDDAARVDGVTWLDLGRLLCDSPYRPRRNIALGWRLGTSTDARRARSRGGTLWTSGGAQWPELTMELRDLDRADALAHGLDLDREVGLAGHVLAIVDPTDGVNRRHLAVYGQLEDLTPVENHEQGFYRKTFRIIGDL